jgi:rubrerythrin
MNLLFPKEQLNVQKCLALAIEGETYEYTEMYPEFRHMAEREGQNYAVLEFSEQIEESKQHAKIFEEMLLLAKKRFAALTKVEERHARQYEDRLANLNK